MSRKHFERLATVLASIRPASATERDPWNAAVQAVASVCRESNPRFDRTRFVEACLSRPSDYEAHS